MINLNKKLSSKKLSSKKTKQKQFYDIIYRYIKWQRKVGLYLPPI